MLSAIVSGFFTGLSLILPVGAQNAFVLRQGLTGRHVLWLCLFCSLSDMILITAGVSGFGAIVHWSPGATYWAAMAAAAFLTVYGFMRLRAAWLGNAGMQEAMETRTLPSTIALAAVFTWANPHVYLDTVGLIGAASTSFGGADRWSFAFGAMISSFVFFFSLGFGAKAIAPIFRSPDTWRVLDAAVGIVMWSLAAVLLINL